MYTKTLASIKRGDREIAGERACDLGLLLANDFSVPLSFVLVNKAFESFIVENKLQNKVAEALTLSPMRSYERIRELFLSSKFSDEMVSEIVENYESLDVRGMSAADIVAGSQAPFVTVILSPNHSIPATVNEGVILNVRGLEELLLAIKECWACLFTPTMHNHREKAGLGNVGLNTGIIIQSSTTANATAEGFSAYKGNPQELLVQSYYGAFDLSVGVQKDEFRLAREFLKPLYQSVGMQAHMLSLDEESRLTKNSIGLRGEEQKLDDRAMIEVGRLTKKASKIIDGHVRIVFDVDGEKFSPILVNRLLLTKGSVKLESFETEEQIVDEEKSAVINLAAAQLDKESSKKSEDEMPSMELETPSFEQSKHSEVTEVLAIREEIQPEIVEEDPQETPLEIADEGDEEVEDHEIQEDKVVEEISLDEEGDEDLESDDEESADGKVDEEDDESKKEDVDIGQRSDEEIIDENNEEESDSIFSSVKEDSIFDSVQESPAPENNNLESAPEDRQPVEQDNSSTQSIEKAYPLVKAALAKRYEARFKEDPPLSGVEMFFQLSSEVIMPHEQEITYLLNIKEKNANYNADDEKRILGVVEEFLEQIK